MLGQEHPDTAQTLFNLAQLLRDKKDHGKSAELYKQIVSAGEEVLKRTGTPMSLWINLMAISHNELAFHPYVPAKNWKEAESHYCNAIELFKKVPSPIDAANAELNLQVMYNLLGQPAGVEWVKALTRIKG